MKLIIHGCFDYGISLGVDDDPFDDKQKLDQFRTQISEKISFPVTAPDNIFPQIGCGIEVSLTDSEISQKWLEDSINESQNPNVKNVLNKTILSDCSLTIYSLGIIYFMLSLDGIGVDDLIWFSELENSSTDATEGRFLDYLKELSIDVISCFGNQKNTIEYVSRRYNLPEISRDDLSYHLTTYLSILLCGTDTIDADVSKISSILNKNRNEDKKTIVRQNCIVKFGKYFLVRPEDPDADYNSARIFYLMKLGNAFCGITRAFEYLFIEEMKSAIKSNISTGAHKRDARYLNQCRMLAALSIDITSPSSAVIWEFDNDLLNIIVEDDDLVSRQDRIRYAADIFKEVQSELNSIEETNRGKKLSRIFLWLTSLTFVTVIANIINTVDFAHSILPGSFERITALLAPLILVYLLIIFIVKKS
jgi:hypothetical protein